MVFHWIAGRQVPTEPSYQLSPPTLFKIENTLVGGHLTTAIANRARNLVVLLPYSNTYALIYIDRR
jgi:hypothetical protein